MIIRKQIQLEELLQLNDVEGLDSDLLDNIEECYVKGEPIEEYLEDDHAMTSEVISTERSKSAGCNMQYKIATLLNKIIQHNNSAMKGLAEPRKVATEKVLQSLKDSFKNGSSLKEGPIVQVIEDASEVIVVDPHDEPQSIETIVMHQNNSRKASTIVVHPNDVNNSKIPTYRITAAPPARGPGSRPRKHANPPPPPVEREPLKFDKRPRLVITPKYLQTLENQRNNTNAEAETYIQFEEIIEVDESQDEEENGMNLVQQEEATDMESDSGENVIGERTRFFNCKTCGVGCPSDLERDVHIKLMHPVPKMTFNGPYKCWYCERIFKLEYSGRKHIILTHLKIHLCPDCGLSFETSAKYLHHRYNVHGTVYTCPEEGCGKQFMGNAKIRDHKETHKDISERKVLVCDRYININLNY